MTVARGRSLLVIVVPAVVVLVTLGVVRGSGGVRMARAVDDLAQLATAALACVVCAWRARHHGARPGRSWAWLAGATGAWTAGEVVWSYYELVSGRQTPFPSAADAGFLLFEVLAVIGLLSWPSVDLLGRRRSRAVLDGIQVAGSLFIISWVSALGAVVHAGTSDDFSFVVSLAYPVSDLVLLTLTVTVLARAPGSWRTGLSPLALGISCLCIGDSGFAYLATQGRYSTGSLVDAGWIGGFLLIAGAAWIARPTAEGPASRRTRSAVTARVLVPYVPAAVALVVVVIGEWTGYRDRVGITAAAVVVATLLIRQLSATADNRRLVEQLVTVEQELRFLAFHDPLTGLANRALFDDHLRHGLELHRRDLRPLMLLFCDLDDFKKVNDTLGHESGDEVLRIAAERLRAATRAADTVARIGGDEFAVLIEGDGDPTGAAARIFEALAQPAIVHRRAVVINATIGVVALAPGARTISAAEFLRRGDAAMYRAKRNGKGSAALWTEDIGTGRGTHDPGTGHSRTGDSGISGFSASEFRDVGTSDFGASDTTSDFNTSDFRMSAPRTPAAARSSRTPISTEPQRHARGQAW